MEKAKFTKKEISEIILNYDLGSYENHKIFPKGNVQTNILLKTTKGKFVFRYYNQAQGRSKNSVLFEANLTKYLKDKNYPCPVPFRNKQGRFVGIHNKKPYVIYEFVEGEHLKNPNESQKKQLIKKVAELQNITKNYRPVNKKYRWNYNIGFCKRIARQETQRINTINVKKKLKWLENELLKLKLPRSLPKGICHCDFHFSNVLFKKGRFSALIDFDDANYTFLAFDLVGLIDSWTWPHKGKLDFEKAKEVLKEYTKHRKLNDAEKKYLFDLYKLSILFDSIWYFKRGDVEAFNEKRKIDYLNNLGRNRFYHELFS